MLARYGEAPPLIDGAVEAVRLAAARWPLAIASSSNPELIEVVLRAAGLRELFPVTVSSQEVARGKPAPDVYLEAARRLGVEPARCAAVEDSHNGIRSAKAAGMRVVAVPNPHFPPDDESLALADAVVRSVGGVDGRAARGLARQSARPSRTQPLWPPSPIAFESATSTRAARASFGT